MRFRRSRAPLSSQPSRQRVVSDALFEQNGEDPVDFGALLERTRKAREEAEKRLENERVKVDSLSNDLNNQKKDNTRYISKLEAANEKLADYEKKSERGS